MQEFRSTDITLKWLDTGETVDTITSRRPRHSSNISPGIGRGLEERQFKETVGDDADGDVVRKERGRRG